MKIKTIVDAPEAVVSRGFTRLDLTQFDAVIIVREGTDTKEFQHLVNGWLAEADKEPSE